MKFGSNTIDAFKLGSANIDALYFGSNLIYTKSAPSLTPLVENSYYSMITFDITKTPDLSKFTLQQGENLIAEFGDENALLIISDLTHIQAGLYIIAIADIPVWCSINYSTFTAGWQSNIVSTSGMFTFDGSYQFTQRDSTTGWNGVWVGSKGM